MLGQSWLPARSSSARHMGASGEIRTSSPRAGWALAQSPFHVSLRQCAFIAGSRPAAAGVAEPRTRQWKHTNSQIQSPIVVLGVRVGRPLSLSWAGPCPCVGLALALVLVLVCRAGELLWHLILELRVSRLLLTNSARLSRSTRKFLWCKPCIGQQLAEASRLLT